MEPFKQEISKRKFRAGYVLVKGIVDYSWDGGEGFEVTRAFNSAGDYIQPQDRSLSLQEARHCTGEGDTGCACVQHRILRE